MVNQKLSLETSPLANFMKLIVAMSIVFLMAKVRYEIGGNWSVDAIFILMCILLAFFFLISYKTNFSSGSVVMYLTVHKNILGQKFITIKCSNGEAHKAFTSKNTHLIEGVLGDKCVRFTDLDQHKLNVDIVDAI